MIFGLVLLLLALWTGVGLMVFWLGTRTPRPGSLRLVRTAGLKIGVVGQEIPVYLWPIAQGVPTAVKVQPPRRVVLVLDHSGSMGAGPASDLEDAKQAAVTFTRNVYSKSCLLAVVEFDHNVSTVCAFGASQEEIVQGVRAIPPGGGTDIALGLAQARIALAEAADSASGLERSVVLLSDGGSHAAPAVAEAQILKDQGVRVISIGLGQHVDAELMKRIASSPQDYYETLEAKDLARLYEQIAGSLTETAAARADIAEAISTDALMLTSTGDFRPYWLDFNGGTLQWFLPYVGETPDRKIAYQATALRWGWHRIARKRATLKMVDRDGLEYNGVSNLSPRVLILPRFLFPLNILLLNPLFWLFIGLFRRREAFAYRLETPPAVAATPLPEAKPVLAPALRKRSGKIPPVLLLAVGHTGELTLRATLHRLKRLYPEVDSMPSHLWIDTGSEPTPGLSAVFGDEIDPANQVHMDASLKVFVDDLRRSAGLSRRLAWLDVGRENFTAGDLDLSRGTAGRRVLARAAFYNHLTTPQPRLETVLDRIIASIDQEYRVIAFGNYCGGTGGGMLLDLLVYLRKRMRAASKEARAVDAFLLANLPPPATALHPVHLRNGRAFATELSRLTIRGHLPLTIPQSPAETDEEATIDHVVDSVLLIESSLEGGEASEWPVGGCHAAAEALLHLLLAPEAGFALDLDNNRAQLRAAQRTSGHAMALGVAGSFRELPSREAQRFLVARTIFDFLSQELLLVERFEGGFRPSAGQSPQKMGEELARGLLHGRGLSRTVPSLLGSLEALADPAEAGAEMGRQIRDLTHYPSLNLPLERSGWLLMGEVLNLQQQAFESLLQEWALQILDGRPQDGRFETAMRRGGLPRLGMATEWLQNRFESALTHIEGMRESVRQAGHQASYDFVRFLFARFAQSIRILRRHVAGWESLLIGPAGAGDKRTPLIEMAAQKAVEAKESLDALVSRLAPSVVWSDQLEADLLRRYGDPVRQDLMDQVVWEGDPGGDQLRLSLTVEGSDGPARFESGADPLALFRSLADLALDLKLHGVLDEPLCGTLDCELWVGSQRGDPVRLSRGQAQAPARRDHVLAPGQVSLQPASLTVPCEVNPAPDLNRISLVRALSPCSLFATGVLADYQRRLGEEPHQRLPFVDPVDRDAAEWEDRFSDFGMSAPFLSPTLRAYFVHEERLRTFALAAACGRLRKILAGASEVMAFESLQITKADRQPGYPMLLEAMDNFIVKGVSTLPPGAIDFDQATAQLEAALRDSGPEQLRGLGRDSDSALQPLIEDVPPDVVSDLQLLTRLFCEIEADRREKRGGSR